MRCLPIIISIATTCCCWFFVAVVVVSGQQQQQSLVIPTNKEPDSSQAVKVFNLQQQQQQQQPLQLQLQNIHQQAQRQLGQLNGLVLNAVTNSSKYSNVIEAISSVGKAIQQQIAGNAPNVNIITSSQGGSLSEQANNKKNEYQSIVVTDQAPFTVGQQPNSNNNNNNNSALYREQGELLRQEIVRRAGQLQQVVGSSMELLKNNGDLIVRRLLEQMNIRLDQAKAKADRIINEPATNEVALRALATINSGLNNLNQMISNIVTRLDLATKEQQLATASGAPPPQTITQRAAAAATNQQIQTPATPPINTLLLPQLLDTSRLKSTVQQLGQQFQSALNSSQVLQQQLALIRQQRLQQQQQLAQSQQQPQSTL